METQPELISTIKNTAQQSALDNTTNGQQKKIEGQDQNNSMAKIRDEMKITPYNFNLKEKVVA